MGSLRYCPQHFWFFQAPSSMAHALFGAISHKSHRRVINFHVTALQNTQPYASLLHNSEPSFLKTCVARPRVKRNMWMTENKCGWSIIHLQKENNKSVFLLDELGNTKKG
ncbi:hypothetical protein TNCV_1934481 [Trichonephila clavipes]|nr:hypothetical protein TNCV_1934481 [Trichonephila clavipes]